MTLSDAFSSRHALGARGLLATFNAAGVIAAADVHVARRLCDVLGETDEDVRLAMALAVRAPRLGHVHVDLATIRETVAVEPSFGDDGEEIEPLDVAGLPWPEDDWAGRVGISRMVSDGPLRIEGSALYLDRYWRDECAVADDLKGLAGAATVDEARLADGLARLFEHDPGGDQAAAAATVLRNRLAIVAGGPGTGKTTTVARILALLLEQDPDAHVALAAPTGKAQSRLQEAIADEVGKLEVESAVRERILGLHASTLHRLLGSRFDNRTRFRHHRGEKLPHDVVIVDETSMVSLSLMARLVEAIRPGGRLVLVGDPGQLASVEAGAVLGDIVGALGPLVARLEYVHRHGGAIAAFGRCIAVGDSDGAIELLGKGSEELAWVGEEALRAPAVEAARAVRKSAEAGDATTALTALRSFRLLCAHRREVAVWTERVEGWLRIDSRERFPAGRPLLVTSNDYDLGLFNGESGVVVVRPLDDRRVAVFERGTEVSPTRLNAVDTSYAMTIHKAQGSQFETAAVVLPASESRLLTRELLYTACTRAQQRLLVCGDEASIRAAIARPIARASGLRERLAA